jgi:hypothetical protein
MVGKILGWATLLLFALWSLRWTRRLIFIKDYGYAVSERFGSSRGLEPSVRLRKAIPWLRPPTVEAWLLEFAKVNDEVWRLARMGGVEHLGWRNVRLQLRTRFPFLRYEGLGQAALLVAYFAMHEGYDISPDQSDPGPG